MEVDTNFENYILDNMFVEPSTMYEGPFESVLMPQSTSSFITSQEDPLLCSSNYEDGFICSGKTLQGGLHSNEDSINLSSHFSSTEIVDNSYFPMPAVCRNSTSKPSCNISVSQESNYSQRPTYNNDYFLPVSESNYADLNPMELDFFASSNFNSVNDLFFEPSWSTNPYQSESSNNLSTENSSFQDVSQTYPISDADSSLSTSRETPPYSFPLPIIDSTLLLLTEPSTNSSNFQEDFSQTFSSSVSADSLLSTSIESSTNSTRVNCSPTRINVVSSPDPVTVPISQPNSFSSQPQITANVDLQNSLSKTSVLQTPPYSPLNQGVSDFELNSIIDTLGSCVETSKFYELANIENAIASFYEFHVKKNIANCVEEIKKEDENLPVEDYGQIKNEDTSMQPSMLNINDESNVLQAFPEDECYLPETPGFSDEDGAMSPSQNILCLTPPPPPPSPVIDPVLLKLQRSVATVDFDHNYFLKNGQSRREFYASTTSPNTYPTTPTSSAQVKRQLKNAIYDKTAQKRKVGRPPKSVNKNSNSTNVNRTSEDPIKTFGRVTFGKPEAYTRRMREEHDEKIKMSTSATASSSKTKNCSTRRRRTTASDPQDDMERRVNHNTMERTRRDFIKQSFETLRSLVPDLKGNPKASKAQILKKAREYIGSYDDEFDRLKDANDRERRRNSELRIKLQKLRAESSSY